MDQSTSGILVFSIHIERARLLRVTFLRRFIFWPKMGIVNNRKFGERWKIIFCSKTVQDYGNKSADICQVMQAVGLVGQSLSMCILRSLWSIELKATTTTSSSRHIFLSVLWGHQEEVRLSEALWQSGFRRRVWVRVPAERNTEIPVSSSSFEFILELSWPIRL